MLNPPFCVVSVYNPSIFSFVPCAFSSTNNFAHAQTLYRMSSLCRSYECVNIVWVNIGVLTEWKKIKLQRTSFVLGYLRMIFLWKISTAISIKYRILTTFDIKKKSNSDNMYAFNTKIKPNGLTQDVSNIVFLFVFYRQQFWQIKKSISPKLI